MSYAQLTPEQPPVEPDGHDDEIDQKAPARPADALRLTQARRLEMLELERATDEGMTPPGPRGLHRPDEDAVEDDEAWRPGIAERRFASDPE